MYYHKYPFNANFDFLTQSKPGRWATVGPSRVRLQMTAFRDDVYRLRVESPRWPSSHSQAGLTPPPLRTKNDTGTAHSRLTVDHGYGLRLSDSHGRVVLHSPSRRTFGVCGDASLFMFHRESRQQFYGMGEKSTGLEHSGRRTKFWNTDVWGDFHQEQCRHGTPDPMYVSIPYLIVKRDNAYIGLLLDNPYATFIDIAASVPLAGQTTPKTEECPYFSLGAENGQPDLYIIYGPSLPELTRKLQKLVGCTPLPPAWALGYHQCRWGYRSMTDMIELDRGFRAHGIPCDGFWLDIDYMDRYRVFTINNKHFADVKESMRRLKAHGRRVVPILDPGVALVKGYSVYEDGHRAGIFCQNPQGREFVGVAWPGKTVFPDFSIAEGRAWWTKHVRRLAAKGIYGAWLDMNDPSTGPVDDMQMLFNHGRASHGTFHNQYALGMAMGSRDGFQQAHPNQRPFLVTRSGSTGVGRYAAIWTGDNYSNYHHLKGSVACSLNLALSGVPFNGPDIGGFGGDTTPDLITAWMKACFLFPFCRNHSVAGSLRQEPWAFSSRVTRTLRRYIRLRYALRPYLYNLFVDQEERGEAILRPLFYDFADTKTLPLGRIEDQFMVGPSIMQAPLLDAGQTSREVTLPGTGAWYSVMTGKWINGNRRVRVTPGPEQTPIFIREGAVIPVAASQGDSNEFDGRRVVIHVMLNRRSQRVAETSYVFDDGETLEYRRGQRSRLYIRARVYRGRLEIVTRLTENGFGHCEPIFVTYDAFSEVLVNGRPQSASHTRRL